jgi:hypothetical protein
MRGWGSKWKRAKSDILIDNFQNINYKLQKLLGELTG